MYREMVEDQGSGIARSPLATIFANTILKGICPHSGLVTRKQEKRRKNEARDMVVLEFLPLKNYVLGNG